MNDTWNALRREAEDPLTSARRLAELAQQDPSLWELILRNPQCDPAYREWILAQRPNLAAPSDRDESPPVGTPAPAPVKFPDPAPPAASMSKKAPRATLAGRQARGGRRHRNLLIVAAALGVLTLLTPASAVGVIWLLSDRNPDPVSAVAEEGQERPRREELTEEPSEFASGEASDESAAEDGASAGSAVEEDTPANPPSDGENAVPGIEEMADEDPAAQDGSSTVDGTTHEDPGTATAGGTSEGAADAPPQASGADDDEDNIMIVSLPGGDGSYVLISSPSLNISCELGGITAGCSIADRPKDSECGENTRVASYLIYDGTYPMRMCEAEYLGVPGDRVITLEYGQTIMVEDHICTSESTGMTCWSNHSGHGMTLSRKGAVLF
ncbi:hypothetical protein JOD52_002903 [Brachybacterium muris]|uniref:variant leucine-rich repeat-containing protein n=1 Tax=Brachybacterium muris TaxID=219301 RepID=UPI0019599EDA|nr:hypothetical protein [Brachybacterium muris]MBM7502063.1 hypothetical protein [Brachybacterium muris]